MGILRWMSRLPWWVFLLVGDFIFVTLSVLFYSLPDFPEKWFLFNPFNLGLEMNLATWWSGISLLALGLISYELFGGQTSQRFRWPILSILFMALSFDEIGSLHERLGNLAGDIAYIPFAIVGGLLVIYVIRTFWITPGNRRTAILLLLGIFLMASAGPQEYLEHRIGWPSTLQGLRLGLEEGTELMGVFLCSAAIIPQRRLPRHDLHSLVPDLANTVDLGKFIIPILAFQILVSLLVVNYIEIGPRGNPAAWLPSASFFVMFSIMHWHPREKPCKMKGVRFFVATLSLFMSVLILYTISLRDTSRLNLPGYPAPLALFAFLSLFVYLFAFVTCKRMDKGKLLGWSLSILSVLLLLIFSHSVLLTYLCITLFSFMLILLFSPDRDNP